MSTPPGAPRRRLRRVVAGLLVLLVVEVALLVQLSHLVGRGWVLLLLLAETAAGALVLRRAGRRALAALRGSPPGAFGGAPTASSAAVGDAVLTGAGGVLLVLPGLISDVLGLLCLFPPTRRRLAGLVLRRVRTRLARGATVVAGDVVGPFGDVVDGEVVETPGELGR